MRYIIEVKDERDKDSSEPWSHFSADYAYGTLEQNLIELVSYVESYPITEVRIRIERDK